MCTSEQGSMCLGEKPAVQTKCRARRDVEPGGFMGFQGFIFTRAKEMTAQPLLQLHRWGKITCAR